MVSQGIDTSVIKAENIKSGVTILGVAGSLTPGITPSGNINITNTSQTDVTNYATAQVVDANLIAANIADGVTILGVTGTHASLGYPINCNVSYGVYTGSIVTGPAPTTAQVTVAPVESASLPDNINVSGADYQYNNQTGLISIFDASGPVTVTVHCETAPYLTFMSSNSFTLTAPSESGSTPTKTWDGQIDYSGDHENWTENWDGTTTLSSTESGGYHYLYLRGVNNSRLMPSTVTTFGGWVITGSGVQCIGTIAALLDYQMLLAGQVPVLADGAFRKMFFGCSALSTAPGLPFTSLTSYCYSQMFYGCTGLTAAPQLPATTLAGHCYESMFNGCTSLTTAPVLPATTLTTYCYRYMFSGCSVLAACPTLPATTLADRCYEYMFKSCAALTTPPTLPATTMATGSYAHMFESCTGLTAAPELPATTLASECYSAMFSGCTSLTTATALRATTVFASCYASMFLNCTNLSTIPYLPASALVDRCYYQMFKGCAKIYVYTSSVSGSLMFRIPRYGNGTTVNSAMTNMFTGTGGTLATTPAINTWYYTTNTLIS